MGNRSSVIRLVVLASALIATSVVAGPAIAQDSGDAPLHAEDLRVEMSDGAEILVRLGGRGPRVDGQLPRRPVIVEFSPYGQDCCAEYGGVDFNHLQVHIRGTGNSDGGFDALGPRSQQDVVEIMQWACEQPWSNGRLGIWGFSASAIITYNTLHLEVPCLEAAVLGSGTFELYRDLLYPGGIPNGLPAAGVFGLIGAPAVALFPDRLGRAPLSLVDLADGFANTAVDYNLHPTLDEWWRQRGFRGDSNDVPILMIDGFFDVESRGAFEAFQELREDGSHLYVVGAHDGVPAGSGGTQDVTERWFRHHLLDEDNGVDREPTVQLWMANGDRAEMLAGDFVTASYDDWPVPGTRWTTLHLDSEVSGTSRSPNDGTLQVTHSPEASSQPYLPVPSLPTATDPPTTSLLGVFNGSRELTLMNNTEPLGLAYTSPPLGADVAIAGPASLELVITSASPESDLYAVISDVWPDGTAHPMAVGRLRTSFPDLVPGRSRTSDSEIIQPYNDFAKKRHMTPGSEHRFHVEFWPIGNVFKTGHRLRLHVVGASGYHEPTVVAPNLVRIGGPDGGSLLRVPVLPGSDLVGALTGTADEDPGADGPAVAPPEPSADPFSPGNAPPDTLPSTGSSPPWAAVASLLVVYLLVSGGRRAFRAADRG